MALIRPHHLGRIIFPQAVWNLPANGKALYLTFDDGPEPSVTPWVLDTLKTFNAKATFFCIGKNAEAHPDIFQRIISEGHAVGNHTYSHLNGWKTSNNHYLEDVAKCTGVINSKLFRPPYGKIGYSQYALINASYSIVMWDVLSKDYSPSITPPECFKRVAEHSRPGSIIVFHDSIKAAGNLRYALPKVLEYFSEKGFNFNAITLN